MENGNTGKKRCPVAGVMPAYNEEENIEKTASEWYAAITEAAGPDAVLIVVNDGSRDSTSEKIRALAAEHPGIIAAEKQNGGHGSAVMYGYMLAFGINPEFIFQTDSDGQTDPSEFGWFWEHRYDGSGVFGVRTKREDGTGRLIVTRSLRLVLSCVYRIPVKDPGIRDSNVPFRLMRTYELKRAVCTLPYDRTLPNIMISAAYVYLGYRPVYRPVTFRPRQGGKNSVNVKGAVITGMKQISVFKEHSRILRRSFPDRKF